MSQQPIKSGGVVSWWRNKFSKRNRKSTPAYTTLHSVPEDSLATPSKDPEPALPRVTDADSANGSPKIHVARQSSFTHSMVVKSNDLCEASAVLQPQSVPGHADKSGQSFICYLIGSMTAVQTRVLRTDKTLHPPAKGIRPAVQMLDLPGMQSTETDMHHLSPDLLCLQPLSRIALHCPMVRYQVCSPAGDVLTFEPSLQRDHACESSVRANASIQMHCDVSHLVREYARLAVVQFLVA